MTTLVLKDGDELGVKRSATVTISVVPSEPPPGELWDRDIEHELYTHPAPTAPAKWGTRRLDEIVGVCLHHTGHSQSPHWVAENYCRGKGRPTMPYTLWITPDGQCLKCVDLELAVWHNHEGSFRNLWLSVGLAGPLHLYRPPNVQIWRAAELIADLIVSDEFPLVNGLARIKGHDDFIKTACPGWSGDGEAAPSGEWRSDFMNLVLTLLPVRC